MTDIFRRNSWIAIVIALAIGANSSRSNAAEPAQPASNNAESPESLPPDLPLPASPANQAAWLRDANVLQPYGHSQFIALAKAGDRPRRLKDEFGFNAIIVQPTDSHNTVAHAEDKLTEEQFREGVAAYRAGGYRLILYTSVMALGLSPEFQSGEISRTHPDWSQRDSKGNPILVWGVPWLCPNTSARDVALDRCIRIAREYKADGIMLDNNQFFSAAAGWTCHCDACKKAFRDYVGRRCGVDKTRRLFGAAPDELQIPTADGPLHAIWMQWRNRVWAEINESFRARLREINPEILLFANTQYAFEDGRLATDGQYQREDVVLSESCELSSRQMSEKMILGHAVAAGRPLWNYIGTFSKPDDYTGLRPASVIGPAIASTIANGARPWIVDGFDDGPTDAAARKEMSRLLGWHGSHPDLFAGRRWAAVGALISIESRNVLHRPLIPPHIAALQSVGTPVIAHRDDEISADTLATYRVMTVETSACLSAAAAEVLAKWVEKGGVLIAASDVGTFDELGRRRPRSTLWHALGFTAAPKKECKFGRGAVIVPAANAFWQTAVQRTRSCSFQIAADSGVEVVPYRADKTLLLHIVRHQPKAGPVKLRLPEDFQPSEMQAHMLIPGSETVQILLSKEEDAISLGLTTVPVYSVVVIPVSR